MTPAGHTKLREPLRTHQGRAQIQIAGEWVYVVDLLKTLDELTDAGAIDCCEPLDDELRRLNREASK